MASSPLQLVEEVERARDECRSRWDRIVRWLDERMPFIFRLHVPQGRLSTEHLLSQRDDACRSDWQDTGLPDEFVDDLLQLIQREFEWPSGHFIPKDPLQLVVVKPTEEEFPVHGLMLALKEQFGFRVTVDELVDRFWSEDATLGEFAAFVYEGTRGTA